ncbi:MAG TPA: hypothetical protein PKA00_02010 [Saprospiraceae bacterium]|nr:hypothetical protein [Saprospiraceae bacterium]HMQ81646.1 hypothetical protein [Saprospiraceae bacterium]
MAFSASTYHSKIFRDFKAIDAGEHRRIIRFYEAYESSIRELDFPEYFDLLVAYTNALFEVGAYQKHLLMADVVIETSIEYNISDFQGKDIYYQTLFRKAAALYNLRAFHQAEYILKELIRIEPYNEDAILFLKKCLRKIEPPFINTCRAIAIFMLLMAALIIGVEVLFIRPFYKIYVPGVETARNSIFFLSCLVILGGFGWHYFKVQSYVNRFVVMTRDQKLTHGSSK